MSVPHTTALRRPRREGDRLVLGQAILLARQTAVDSRWETVGPSDAALADLLSQAYQQPADRIRPIIKAVCAARAALIPRPSEADALLAPLPEPPIQGIAALTRRHAPGTQTAAPPDLPPVPAHSPTLCLTDRGVVLGKGTVIASLRPYPDGVGLDVTGNEDRILTLLSLAGDGLVDPERVLTGFHAASHALRRGETVRGAIALCHLNQPPLHDDTLTKGLLLADQLLTAGMSPLTLLKRQGLLPPSPTRSDEVRKENENHYPGGVPDGKGGEFAPKDGTSGTYGDNIKIDYVREKIEDALKGKKSIALVGGANDDREDGPMKKLVAYMINKYPGADIKYFDNEGNPDPKTDNTGKNVGTLKEWLQKKIAENGSDNVAAVGHSWGGDTVASVVSHGVKIGALITLDPVSQFRPNMENIRENAKNWININANPDKTTRENEPGWGNFLAGIGGDWGNTPQKYAHHHYNANVNHAEISDILTTIHSTSKNTPQSDIKSTPPNGSVSN